LKKVILLNKAEGETPLACLERFRSKHKEYKNVPMTYAGRLDPLVRGLLLVLAGNGTKEKERYLKLSKEYNFTILFGFATDTYDILGKVTSATKNKKTDNKEDLEKKIKENLKYFTGKFTQEYPMYSSKTVSGKPLFLYARENKKVNIPKREVVVYKLKFIKMSRIRNHKLLKDIKRRVNKVKGDFRQKEILCIWQKKLSQKLPEKFLLASFKIKCGSGTYVRSIANSLGDRIGMPALALSIKRTKIGKWGKA
jgi:tRNA pseudouridine55 synthase